MVCVMLYPCMSCVGLSMDLFVLCVACLTVFVNCIVKLYSMFGCVCYFVGEGVLDTVAISDKDVCCSVVYDTLVGVFVFSVMWSELLICYLLSSVVNQCTSAIKWSVRLHLW